MLVLLLVTVLGCAGTRQANGTLTELMVIDCGGGVEGAVALGNALKVRALVRGGCVVWHWRRAWR